MFQRPPSVSRNCISAPGRSGNSKRHSRSCAHVGRTAADHVAHVQLRHLVVGQIDRLVAARRAAARPALGRPARDCVAMPTKMCACVAAAQPVVELGDDAAADARRRTRGTRPGRSGIVTREQRLARFAELGALGDEAQAIEVHVGAAQHRDEPLRRVRRSRSTHGLQPGDRQRAGRLHDRCACRRRRP